jgi:hypothetical protein
MQTIKALPHVCRAGRYVNPCCRAEAEHCLTPCPVSRAGAGASPHRIHDPIQCHAHCATGRPKYHRPRQGDLNLMLWTKSLPREASDRRPLVPISAPAADTYPRPLPTRHAADKNHPASNRWLHTPRPASPLPPDSAASVLMSLRSSTKSITTPSRTTGALLRRLHLSGARIVQNPSGPAEADVVDFVRADVAGEERVSIRCNAQPGLSNLILDPTNVL